MQTMATLKSISPSPQEVPMLLQHLQSASEVIKFDTPPQNEDIRKMALNLAKSLVSALENPEEVVMRWGFEV